MHPSSGCAPGEDDFIPQLNCVSRVLHVIEDNRVAGRMRVVGRDECAHVGPSGIDDRQRPGGGIRFDCDISCLKATPEEYNIRSSSDNPRQRSSELQVAKYPLLSTEMHSNCTTVECQVRLPNDQHPYRSNEERTTR